MKIRILLSAIAFSATSLGSYAQVFLTGFGVGDYIDQTSSTSFSQDATSATFNGPDAGDAFFGAITLADISGFVDGVQITATLHEMNNTTFTLQLADGDFNTRDYVGSWSSFTVGAQSTVTLVAATPGLGSFNASNVQGLNILFGGVNGTLNITFDGLSAVASAIPEPTTWAAMLGGAALFMVVGRRRRRTAA